MDVPPLVPSTRSLDMSVVPLRISALIAAALTLASAVEAQQRLFLLDSGAQIWRVEGHTTTAATLVPVVQVNVPGGFTARDLAFDPVTQGFVVLAASATQVQLLAVDPSTGATVTRCVTAGAGADGLDRRSDGVLVFAALLNELVLVDPASCLEWRVPTREALGQHTSSVSLAFDSRGMLVSMSPDTALTVDPLDGETWAPPFAMGIGTHAFEIHANGDQYVATFPWTLVRRNSSPGGLVPVVITNPPPGRSLIGLALEESAEGASIAHVCDGLPNSTGRSSTLELNGVPVVGMATLELRSRGLPPGSLGYFLMGPNSGSLPVASGLLCISTPVYRNSATVLTADSLGHVRLPFATSALPVGIPLQPGDSYVFQYWHRDVGSTANFSAARHVTFL